jgi:hypothetical protein
MSPNARLVLLRTLTWPFPARKFGVTLPLLFRYAAGKPNENALALERGRFP